MYSCAASATHVICKLTDYSALTFHVLVVILCPVASIIVRFVCLSLISTRCRSVYLTADV